MKKEGVRTQFLVYNNKEDLVWHSIIEFRPIDEYRKVIPAGSEILDNISNYKKHVVLEFPDLPQNVKTKAKLKTITIDYEAQEIKRDEIVNILRKYVDRIGLHSVDLKDFKYDVYMLNAPFRNTIEEEVEVLYEVKKVYLNL